MEKNEARQPDGISRDVQADTIPVNIKAGKKGKEADQRSTTNAEIFHTILYPLKQR